ncbi:tail fiber protein [Paenibacillus silvae]|uniref:tail fiber protein n=1 Tax=Paenibacillus silvae TaxID=1325358 RepID=UPI002004FB9B|nr:tail fiber protein [Paenibacillus silvae]MCK6075249.1 phage tail protein [Paenibacillus silvae]MCK6149636.1 phage tail protein [Paenibacillus silvae]MCK6267934.1 phage tail protein [Paenibacillus silvae]
MPIETNRLKLPLPLGNESVSRVGINNIFEKIDEGVATRDEVEKLRQLVSEIDVPDASLTQKGIVQLSNATESNSDTEAATPKAVKVAYDRGSAGVTAAQAAQDIINNRDGYEVTTNSDNTYAVALSPAPTAYVDGLRITIKISDANTGAVTINVNGLGAKNVLKSNGSAMTANALRANSVYSLVYNGTTFILQGEGGEYGTAKAGDVLVGKTIGTEDGLVTGTIVNRGAGGTVTPGATTQTKLAGYYSSDITISSVSTERIVSTLNIPVGSFAYASFPKLPQLTYINTIDAGNNYIPSGLVMVGSNPNVIKDPNSGSIIAETFTNPRNSGRSFNVSDWDSTNKRFRIGSNSGTLIKVQSIGFLDTITP